MEEFLTVITHELRNPLAYRLDQHLVKPVKAEAPRELLAGLVPT